MCFCLVRSLAQKSQSLVHQGIPFHSLQNQYTQFFSCHPLSVKKGFVKGEALRLLRTNSVKESFELKNIQFLTRLLERGYPKSFAEGYLSRIKVLNAQYGFTNLKQPRKLFLSSPFSILLHRILKRSYLNTGNL